MLRDFTECEIVRTKMYGGTNGFKKCVLFNGKKHMLKLPSRSTRNSEISYNNDPYSEHIGCKVFEHCGISAQKTLLGFFMTETGERPAVLCEDLGVIQDFASMRNTVVDNSLSGSKVELSAILEVIVKQEIYPTDKLIKFFWEMFVVDALLGNFDRHTGNWGFILNPTLDELEISPVFDCGSCLFPQMDEKLMLKVMKEPKELKIRIYQYPNSTMRINGEKINYYMFLTSNSNSDCTTALKEITKRIDMSELFKMIDGEVMLSKTQKDFYKFILKERKEKILDKALHEIENNLEGKTNIF